MRAGTVLIAVGGALLLASVLLAAVFMTRAGDRRESSEEAANQATPAELRAVTDEIIAFFQDRVERDPADFVSLAKLGDAYIRQGRETGDVSAYERADAAFRRALALRPEDADAGAGLATALMAKHAFAEALDRAERVLALDPGATKALAIIGDANLELGNYDAAAAAYGELAAVASGPAVRSRLAHLAELTGDPARAIDHLKRAEEEISARAASEGVAWYRLQLGRLHFNTGQYDDAERWYAASLETFPGYAPALAGLARVAASRGDDAEAIALYEQAVAVVPQPAFLAALGDLYARGGDAAAAQRQYETVEFIGQLAEINRVVYNRELALFYADHDLETARAVELALAELEIRRDIYAFDTAAWALYKNGRAAEAAPLMERALRLGTQDASLLFHAGMIALGTGDREAARSYLEQALAISPRASVLYEPEARRTLAALNEDPSRAEAAD